MVGRYVFMLATLLASGRPPLTAGQYGWTAADMQNTDIDPWVPCDKPTPDGGLQKGFCRLSCTASWSFAPELNDCRMLPWELLERSHSQGMFAFRKLSQDSNSKVNSGPSDPEDPDVALL